MTIIKKEEITTEDGSTLSIALLKGLSEYFVTAIREGEGEELKRSFPPGFMSFPTLEKAKAHYESLLLLKI